MAKQKIILKGTGASRGEAEGPVKKILTKADFALFKEGDILVAKITDPSYVVLMAKAVGIITDIGGLTSHPAIVSREFGIPCVVATKKATAVLKNGEKVFIDGAKGIVYERKPVK